jgi:hypothetical protein
VLKHSIFWLSVTDEGYFNLLTERTWWRLFQSFDWAYLMKVISIFWLSVPDEGYFNLLTERTWWRLFQKCVVCTTSFYCGFIFIRWIPIIVCFFLVTIKPPSEKFTKTTSHSFYGNFSKLCILSYCLYIDLPCLHV